MRRCRLVGHHAHPVGRAARVERVRPAIGAPAARKSSAVTRYLTWLARRQPSFIQLVRVAIFIVMAWIGGLKFVPYEAESIVPFVANSPVMKFFYAKPAPEYKQYMNKEGELVPKNLEWHQENRTYVFADALGTVIIAIGILLLLGLFSPKLGFVGALLAVGMSFVTLSFLITTPEAWVSHFPYLAGGGRLVVKDLIMLSGALVCLSSSAQELLRSMDPRLPDGRGAGPDGAEPLARIPSRDHA